MFYINKRCKLIESSYSPSSFYDMICEFAVYIQV